MSLNQGPSPKVSVLVPVFNAQPFLRQCLDSLVGQTLDDIEIICINDGSTDSSPDVLREYAARDGRIRIIDKPNSGYGDSMNRGLAEARGQWVGICEPDDFCDRRMFRDLLKEGERRGVDLVKANYCTHAEDTPRDPLFRVLDAFPYNRVFAPRELPRILFCAPSIWTGLYRRDMLTGAGIAFSPTPGASYQDTSFAHQCWMSARSVVLLKKGYYHYRIDNAASSSKSGDKVFAVCGEFDRSLSFLQGKGGPALADFGPTLTAVRHGVYRWNYNRIFPEHHLSFAQRWEADMVAAYDQGILDPAQMTPEFRTLLDHVLEGAESFCRRYPDEIPELPIL